MTVKQTIRNENVTVKDLPISIASFPKIVNKNLVYVDKTPYLHPLVKKGGIVREEFFNQFDIENIDTDLLLFQAGYLTVKKYDGERYTLSYPNKEVQSAFFHFL